MFWKSPCFTNESSPCFTNESSPCFTNESSPCFTNESSPCFTNWVQSMFYKWVQSMFYKWVQSRFYKMSPVHVLQMSPVQVLQVQSSPCFTTCRICSRDAKRKQESGNVIGWRSSELFRQPITLLNSCFRFASREQIRLVENGLYETFWMRIFERTTFLLLRCRSIHVKLCVLVTYSARNWV